METKICRPVKKQNGKQSKLGINEILKYEQTTQSDLKAEGLPNELRNRITIEVHRNTH